jgi:hypothetical protein
MKDFQNEIVETVKNFSFEQETALVLTGGNGLNADTAAPKAFLGSSLQIAARIENAEFGGGADGVIAIEKSLGFVAGKTEQHNRLDTRAAAV